MRTLRHTGKAEPVCQLGLLHQFVESLRHVVFLRELAAQHETELDCRHYVFSPLYGYLPVS